VWASFKNKVNPERMFSSKRSLPQPRSIYVNTQLPPESFDKKGRVPKENLYATNQSITSKYTVITFVPRNLFEQVSPWPGQLARAGGRGRRAEEIDRMRYRDRSLDSGQPGGIMWAWKGRMDRAGERAVLRRSRPGGRLARGSSSSSRRGRKLILSPAPSARTSRSTPYPIERESQAVLLP
jgi:hypothetical protein